MREHTQKLTNTDLARVFQTIADLLEIKGENIYKVLAYRKAADSIANLGRDIADVWEQGELNTVPGIGKAISEKIDELMKTGALGFLERLEAEVPISLIDLLRIPDVGPKKAALFWRNGILDMAGLEAAARQGKLRGLPGIGEKSEARILAGIEALARRTDRIPLGMAYPLAQELVEWLRHLPNVSRAEAAGSLRRMKPTIGDLDLLAATSEPGPVMEALIENPRVAKVYAQGETKTSVELTNGMRAQLWLYPPDQFGTALQYATGSKDHSVHLREIALARGLSLSDQALVSTKDNREILAASETEVYEMLGMPWIPPEIREDRGEIEAAQRNHLPSLVELSDLRAELHTHSTWSDGQVSIGEMAEAAQKRGLKVLAITDHSASLGIAGGLKPEDYIRQRKEIDRVQEKMGDSLRLLQGGEIEIRADGALDFPDEVLSTLDIVIASLHTSLRQPREVITKRLLNAIRNPHVDMIGHPTGRLIPDREGADLDMEAVLTAAAEEGTALEINAHPSRLDLEDIYVRRAQEMGIPLSINTDAHAPDQLDLRFYGVAMARRGWVSAGQVINAWPTPKLLDWLKA